MKKKFCLICGEGFGTNTLNSFDNALINAGVGNYNLVKISSILPPGFSETKVIKKNPGDIIHVAFTYLTTPIHNATISSAIAVGIPKNHDEIGVIMECSIYGQKSIAEKSVKDMITEAMKTRKIGLKTIILCSKEIVNKDIDKFATTFAGLVIF